MQAIKGKTEFQTKLLWLALLGALSPSLVALAKYHLVSPWAHYSLLFPFLLLALALEEQAARPQPGLGYLLTLSGLCLTLLPSLAGSELIRFARPGIPIAVIGLALILGRPSFPVSLLALWMIPLPSALLKLAAPFLNSVFLSLASLPLKLIAPNATTVDCSYQTAAGSLSLSAGQNGLSLLVLLTGLGWFAGLRELQKHSKPTAFPSLVLKMLLWGAWAIPIQLGALFIACSLTLAGSTTLCGVWLDHGLWFSVAGLSLVFIVRGREKGAGNVRAHE